MTPRSSAGQACDVADRVAFLAGAPLFGQLSQAVLEQVVPHFHMKCVPRSGFVFLEGTPASSLNLLADGRVKVIRGTDDGQEVILRLIEPGEIFGGGGGWGESAYPASARAQDDAVVLQLPVDSFSDLIARQPAFALAVVHELGQRLRIAEARIRELQRCSSADACIASAARWIDSIASPTPVASMASR